MQFLASLHQLVWGVPALALILGVGIYLTWRTGGAQFVLFSKALKRFVQAFSSGKQTAGVSPFRALCTALGATVGTGNIVGVAGAICLGGPGAIFWMWICGILGMITKFAEATLAVHFRLQEEDGYTGGPMYTITHGMSNRWKPLACFYSFFGLIAAFGIGNTAQINAVISGIHDCAQRFGGQIGDRQNLAFGLILAVLMGSVLLGGAKRIGATAEMLVPFASAFYILLCTGVLVKQTYAIDDAFCAIITGAFSPGAVTGGVLGSAVQALRIGCSRGVFTNEAGMGTASIAHACADVFHPIEQGLLGIVEVFLDTILLCTLTALVILTSGISIPYGADAGSTLTALAFSQIYGDWVYPALTALLCCFAVATILGWGLYGQQCVRFLFGTKAGETYALLQTCAVVVGAVLKTETIWLVSELLNGLMAIPNLIALAVLTPELCRLTNEYKKKSGGNSAEGGNHADFHQCQPL